MNDPDAELALDTAARLLTQDAVTLAAHDPGTGEVVGTLTFTVTERDADGLPVKVAIDRAGGHAALD